MAEGSEPRRGSLRLSSAEKASRARNEDIAKRQAAAEEIARAERMSGMRYRAAQRPTRTTKPGFYPDEEAGDPRSMMDFEALTGPLGGPSVTIPRNRAYARADQAAMDRDVRRMTGADEERAYKKGGPVKKMASGGAVKSSASNRGDGCATRGKTKGRMV
jgi:hypothetical protein